MKAILERGKIMKRNKGFTLIELLAVIVILAIIALIAVPVVMNIINKANKSAFKDSAYGILKAGDSYYTSELLEDAEGITEDVTFTFPNNIEGLEFQGSKPTGGTMTVRKDGKISMAIHNGKYCVTKGFEDEDIQISDDISNCKALDGTLTSLAVTHTFNETSTSTSTIEGEETVEVPACILSKTKCDVGTPVAIKVNATETYKFYVINDDTTKNEVTLIMNRNLGEKVAWYKDNDDTTNKETNSLGPITALNYLNEQTSNWDNIPTIRSYIYDNNLNGTNPNGYQKLKIENGIAKLTSKDGATITEITEVSRARLLTYEEATSTTIGCTGSVDSCPEWIYANLSVSNTTEMPYGYWLLSASTANSGSGRSVSYDGYVYNSYVYDVISSGGLRPVITLSK